MIYKLCRNHGWTSILMNTIHHMKVLFVTNFLLKKTFVSSWLNVYLLTKPSTFNKPFISFWIIPNTTLPTKYFNKYFFVNLFIWLSYWPSHIIDLTFLLFMYIPTCLTTNLPIYLPLNLPTYLFIYLPTHLPITYMMLTST